MEIGRGEFICLSGPNGSGKTSLLRILAGLIPAIYPGRMEGRVLYEGRELTAETRIPGICLTGPWAASRLFCRTVREELTFSPGADAREALRLLNYFGVPHLLDRHPQTLSGGEQQLILLIAYLCCRPELLLLDECFAQLSTDKRDLLESLLLTLHREGKTVILVEHHPPQRLKGIARTLAIRSGASRNVETARLRSLPSAPGESPATSEGAATLLELRNLTTAADHPVAIRYPDIQIFGGEVVHIRGAVGAGKTTLFRLIHGLLPSRGEIRFKGRPLKNGASGRTIRSSGTVLQSPDAQFFRPTVEEEITFAARRRNDLDVTWFRELGSVLGLEDALDRNPFNLSHGEKKKCQIASALIRKPEILFLDEPDAGMDLQGRRDLSRLFALFRRERGTILFTSHNPEFPAALRREGLTLRPYDLSEAVL